MTDDERARAMRSMAAHTDKSGDCWLWTGFRTASGYGTLHVGKKHWRAARLAYVLAIGDISDGLTVDHLCRNRACVNPAHLEIVTRGENTMRGAGPTATNARLTHCRRGHEFTPENTSIRAGRRRCLTCARDAATADRRANGNALRYPDGRGYR